MQLLHKPFYQTATRCTDFLEAESSSYSQGTLRLLWKADAQYRLYHRSQPLDPVLIQINLGHTLTPNSFTIHFSNIFPSKPRSSK